MFDRFSLPDLAKVSRRTMLGAIAVGVVGLATLALFDQPWAGLGLCVGLALGISNFRLVQRSVVKVGRRMPSNKRRPLAVNTMGRMTIITAVALGLLFLLPPFGFGLLGGLALFQFLLLGNVTRSMLAMGSGGAGTGTVVDATGEDAGGPAVDAAGEDDKGRGTAATGGARTDGAPAEDRTPVEVPGDDWGAT